MSWTNRRRQLHSLAPELQTLLDKYNISHSPQYPQYSSFDLLLDSTALLPSSEDHLDALVLLRKLRLSRNDFVHLTCLSSNHFSSVHLALTHIGSRPLVYVLKTVEKRFESRLRDQSSITHEKHLLQVALDYPSPHIPRLIAAFQDSLSLSIILEYLPGGSLQDLLDERVSGSHPYDISETWVRHWAKDCIKAIEWVHNKGWAHRDIKPQNILIACNGMVKLADFGSAAPFHLVHKGTIKQRYVVESKYCLTPIGTVDYLAPEILEWHQHLLQNAEEEEVESLFSPLSSKGSRKSEVPANLTEKEPYGPEVDWWSLGVSIYELLYGIAPFYAPSIPDTYEKILSHNENLSLPSKESFSDQARNIIQSLLVQANERLGRNGAKTVQRHPWFKADLGNDDGRYIPSPKEIEVDEKLTSSNKINNSSSEMPPPPSLSSESKDRTKIFDFSAFFSSPGLSILRQQQSKAEEASELNSDQQRRWIGFTYTPGLNAFDENGYGHLRKIKPTAALGSTNFAGGNSDNDEERLPNASFFTPARQQKSIVLSFSPSESKNDEKSVIISGGAGGTSSNKRRGLTDLEAWGEMLDYAVLASAKKKRDNNQQLSTSRLDLSSSLLAGRGAQQEQQNNTSLPISPSLSRLNSSIDSFSFSIMSPPWENDDKFNDSSATNSNRRSSRKSVSAQLQQSQPKAYSSSTPIPSSVSLATSIGTQGGYSNSTTNNITSATNATSTTTTTTTSNNDETTAVNTLRNRYQQLIDKIDDIESRIDSISKLGLQ